MLTAERIEAILEKLPSLCVGVVGDLFLDQYLHLDGSLTEPSLETGLDSYQVVDVVNSPGAAGTVLNNLVALDVGCVKVLSFIGMDGRGFELKSELLRRGVDISRLLETPERRTPTYTKPMLVSPEAERGTELNRLDIQNRTPTPPEVQDFIVENLTVLWGEVDALLVVDQVAEDECGVVTTRVRNRLAALGARQPGKPLLVDSRARVGRFKNCWTKPNRDESLQASRAGGAPEGDQLWLGRQTQRPVFCTLGGRGIFLVTPPEPSDWVHFGRYLGMETLNKQGPYVAPSPAARKAHPKIDIVPAFPVTGPIDVVGAGDSTAAGIACAYAAGARLTEAAAFGNLVASITIQQLGTTGTATPEQVRHRWQEIQAQQAAL